MMPLTELSSPDYPFQLVCADHFMLNGYQYLAIVDRFSGWPVIEFCGPSNGESRKVMATFRQYFRVYGVPAKLSTDGATVFMSGEFQSFLGRFGIQHRVSSAYNPHSNHGLER